MASPNLGLILPVPGVTGALGTVPSGQSWLELLNTALGTVLDQHDHSLGKGLPVRVAGLVIDSDLPFGSKNATGLRSARFNAQASPLGLASDVAALYCSGADLYFNDTTGAQIRITASGGVAGTPGSISGMSGGAAVTYTLASKLFSFQSTSGIRAFLEAGPISIFDPVTGGKAATLQVPSGLAANYTAKLWGALPAAQKIVTLDNAGQLAAAYDVDGVTLAIASSLLKIAASGVQGHLPAPVNATFTAGSGTLTAGTYYYRVTALNAQGETTPSAETSLTVGASAGVNVNWNAVTGATGYKIYGRSTGAELLMATVGAVTTWLDNGSVTPSGAMPTVNTAAQQIAAGTVLGVNIAAGTVGRTNMQGVGQQISASSGTFSTTSTSFVDVTNLSVTITTTGRPVIVALVPDGSGLQTNIQASSTTVAPSVLFQLLRGVTVVSALIGSLNIPAPGNPTILVVPPPGIIAIDPVAAGTYTYKVQAASNSASATAFVNRCVLAAYEL